MLSTIRLSILGGLILVLVGAFWYVTGLRADLERSQQNVDTLERSVQEQTQLIDRMQRDQQEILDAREEMQEIVRRQSNEIDELRSRFDKSADGTERDFGRIAVSKPGLVENIINRASSEAIRCMEIASGAEPTQEEVDEDIRSRCNLDSSP